MEKESSEELKVYTNKKVYSSETYELRTIFQTECIIIPYTLYYSKIKSRLPEKLRNVLDRYKQLTYDINSYKKHTSKCYEKNLVSYLKKLYKYGKDSKKLQTETCSLVEGKYVVKEQYRPFVKPNTEEFEKYKQYYVKGWKNHPVYKDAKRYYQNLAERNTLRDKYNALDEKILEKCKQLWLKNYENNHKHINTKARDRFWELARGLVISTIDQLYTMDIPENLSEIVDETLGRIYEGLMCFYDPSYKIDTFIYSVTMSKISAYERSRKKKEDAPELFHNMDDVETIHDYYGFANPKLPAILEGDRNMFLERHKSWENSAKELLIYD